MKPLISRIINQLAVDADKFFDEVAFQNDLVLKEEAATLLQRSAEGAVRRSAATMARVEM